MDVLELAALWKPILKDGTTEGCDPQNSCSPAQATSQLLVTKQLSDKRAEIPHAFQTYGKYNKDWSFQLHHHFNDFEVDKLVIHFIPMLSPAQNTPELLTPSYTQTNTDCSCPFKMSK